MAKTINFSCFHLLLAEYFLKRFCEKRHRPLLTLSPETRKILSAYQWPGKVRELENFMERLSILCDGPTVRPEDLPHKILESVGDLAALPPPPAAEEASGQILAPSGAFRLPDLDDMFASQLGLKEFLDSMEDRLLLQALEKAGGVKNQAAEILGIKRTTLIEKLKKKKIIFLGYEL